MDERDKYVGYCKSNHQLSKELELQNKQYVSSVYNEEIALKIIRDCIVQNTQQIAIWLREPDRILSLLYIGDLPLGIVKKQGNKEFEPVFSAIIIIKKSEKANRNRSGFYVERISPIPGMICI